MFKIIVKAIKSVIDLYNKYEDRLEAEDRREIERRYALYQLQDLVKQQAALIAISRAIADTSQLSDNLEQCDRYLEILDRKY